MPSFVLLREEELQNSVFGTPRVIVEVRIDGHDLTTFKLSELESRDPLNRDHVLNSAQRSRLAAGTANGAKRIGANAAAVIAATTASRHIATVEFQCPTSDWSYCEEEFNACDATCDPYDPYNNCQACRDNYNYCVNGQPQGQPVTEETVVSYTDGQFYCALDGSGMYRSRTQHVHHVEYQYWWCKESGQYQEVTSNYYFDRVCFHWFDYDCTFSVGYFDPDQFCSY